MFTSALKSNKDFYLVFGVVLILAVLFVPMPPMFLDFAILVNFGLGLTILILTLYVSKPVEFSTFPSLLLISTLYRLALNVAATRLILTNGDAGDVINSIGEFAVAGNFVVGLVVFFILIVVQYVVVTAGAQRVSEVAARFMLDSMPGQQMSIDADLNMGLIDQAEAVQRRSALEKEASFYGAMDGASKFVKGDAIAGVIILLINIIAGWIIGVVQMGMDWQTALHRFTLLTIGDGIATQLPALVISIATGIIVTRSSADKQLGTEVLRQLTSTPRVLLFVAGIIAALLLLPGMPKWPIVLIAAATVAFWYFARRSARSTTGAEEPASDEIGDHNALSSAPLCVALGSVLGEAWRTERRAVMERIASLRDAHERALGVAFPAVRFVDDHQLASREYEIRMFGVRYGRGEIEIGQSLAIRGDQSRAPVPGTPTTDPAFGLPAIWIERQRETEARDAGYTVVDALTVFSTHMGEVLRANASALLTRGTTATLLDGVRTRQPGLTEELIPSQLSISDVQRVLQNLLNEGVSVMPLDVIAEHLVDLARSEKDVNTLTEALRQRLGHAICDRLKGRHKELAVISLDPRLENQIQASVTATGKRDTLAIDPKLAERLLRKLIALSNDMMREGREPVLLCGADIRRQVRALARRALPKLSVLSVAEIPMNIDLKSQGIVRIESDDAANADFAGAGVINA